MQYEIKQRRVIDDKPGFKHRGKNASLAISSEGYKSWGFGSSSEAADKDAISELALLLKSKR